MAGNNQLSSDSSVCIARFPSPPSTLVWLTLESKRMALLVTESLVAIKDDGVEEISQMTGCEHRAMALAISFPPSSSFPSNEMLCTSKPICFRRLWFRSSRRFLISKRTTSKRVRSPRPMKPSSAFLFGVAVCASWINLPHPRDRKLHHQYPSLWWLEFRSLAVDLLLFRFFSFPRVVFATRKYNQSWRPEVTIPPEPCVHCVALPVSLCSRWLRSSRKAHKFGHPLPVRVRIAAFNASLRTVRI